jgi:hypothetical protein
MFSGIFNKTASRPGSPDSTGRKTLSQPPADAAASKKPRTTSPPAVATANPYDALADSDPAAPGSGGGTPPPLPAPLDTSLPASQQPAARSYAATAANSSKTPPGNRKRQPPTSSGLPAPQKVRARPIYQHAQYASMKRPCPKTASPDVGFFYLNECTPVPSFDDVLEKAFDWIGEKAVGYAPFPAQATLAIVFPTLQELNQFADKHLPDIGLQLYRRPPTKVELRRYTLRNVPVHNLKQLQTDLIEEFKATGEIVDLTPLKAEKVNWYADSVHVTVRLNSPTVVDGKIVPVPDPDPIITVMNADIYVDIPGARRVCSYCNNVEHTNPKCRQGQRQKAQEQRKQRQQQAKDSQAQQTQAAQGVTWDVPDDVLYSARRTLSQIQQQQRHPQPPSQTTSQVTPIRQGLEASIHAPTPPSRPVHGSDTWGEPPVNRYVSGYYPGMFAASHQHYIPQSGYESAASMGTPAFAYSDNPASTNASDVANTNYDAMDEVHDDDAYEHDPTNLGVQTTN